MTLSLMILLHFLNLVIKQKVCKRSNALHTCLLKQLLFITLYLTEQLFSAVISKHLLYLCFLIGVFCTHSGQVLVLSILGSMHAHARLSKCRLMFECGLVVISFVDCFQYLRRSSSCAYPRHSFGDSSGFPHFIVFIFRGLGVNWLDDRRLL